MKKTTITQQLEEALREIEYQKGRFNSISEKLQAYEEKEKTRLNIFRVDMENYRKENSNLLEVIRWQINPETAKYPYEVEKNQRSEHNNGDRMRYL